MNNDSRILKELLDSYRTPDDLLADEMSELADALRTDPAVKQRLSRIQAIDEKLGQAIHDVPIPAGLKERLLAAVENSQVVASAERVASEP